VQELLGHAWVTTTQRYTHLEIEDLQAQVADLPANPRHGIGRPATWHAERAGISADGQ
jgi:hypothetical protein